MQKIEVSYEVGKEYAEAVDLIAGIVDVMLVKKSGYAGLLALIEDAKDAVEGYAEIDDALVKSELAESISYLLKKVADPLLSK